MIRKNIFVMSTFKHVSLLALFLLCTTSGAFAKWLPVVTSRLATTYDPLNPLVPLAKISPTANTIVSNLRPAGNVDAVLRNKIEFGIDVHYPQYMIAATTTSIGITIRKYDNTGAFSSSETKTLTVTYNPGATSLGVQDKDVYVLATPYTKFEVVLDNVNGSTTTDLPFNLYIELSIEADRIVTFTGGAVSPSAINTIDLNGGGIPDELEVTWPTLTGAEEYQLEWTFVNCYGTTTSSGSDISPTALNYSFKNNSTRITTQNNSYRIPILFDRGYVLFRIRGIGKNTTSPYDYIFGNWGGAAESGLVSAVSSFSQIKILDTWVHENNKNWQVTTTFAEEGKKKEVVSYFDGSLRNRQTITRIEGDNGTTTDNNIIVGETVYDYQGRPAVTVLPTPTERVGGAEQRLAYYPNFNKDDAGGEYTALDFDRDATVAATCSLGIAKMSNTTGAANYYSSSNVEKTAQQAHVPDAEQYPFTQVEYTPDNTGRIKRQGGVGKDFQLNSGHETKYFYGQPNQEQLDRLFGSEVGNAAHYKKNLVIDPNGQASVSYLDQEGRVVATALAGDNPTNLTALTSQATAATSMDVDLFAKNAAGISSINTKNIELNGIEFQTQFMVSAAGNHTFNYDFNIAPYTEACLAENVCFNCIYDLTLSIKDECGVEYALVASNPINTVVGQFTTSGGNLVFNTTCGTNASYTYTSSPAIYLPVGTYTISKILTVNQQAVDYYVQQYLDPTKNTCAQTLQDFEDTFVNAIDFSNCEIDCNECIAALGDRDEFVSSGKGTAMEYDIQMDECKKMCKKIASDCELAFEQMKADVSPGGQYAEYLSSTGTISPTDFRLSILNSSNELPAHLVSSSAGYWQKPKTMINGTPYYDYFNADGTAARIVIAYNPSAIPAYSPNITNTGLVTLDATGAYTTPLTNLANVSDFIARWKPEYALGLVTYHPEYIYYEKCTEYGKVQTGYTLSSDEYDEIMMGATTFATANSADPTKDFINSTLPFTPWTCGGSNICDGFYASLPTTPVNLQSQFVNAYNNYATIGGTTYNVAQFAAILARCGSPIPATVATTCDDFGTGTTTAILDAEWNNYKEFYQSLKDQFKQKVGDLAAVNTTTTYGCNDCIGNADDYNPFTSGMLLLAPGTMAAFFAPTVPYFNTNQPCGAAKRSLYANKVPRFPDVQNISGSISPSDAAYQVYLQTGQCPKAQAVEQVFNAMAVANKINAASEDLTPYPEFNNYYVVSTNYAPTTGIVPGMDYDWKATVVSTHVLTIEWRDAANVLKQTFTITKPASISAWSDIVHFSALEALTPTSFEIKAHLSTGTIATITATTDLNMYACNFAETCKANDYARDIQNLMSALAINGHLAGTTNLSSTAYSALMTATIKSVLGTPNTNVSWTYNSGTKTFTMQDAGAGTQKITFTILDPASPVFTSVKYYTDIVSEGYNIFTMVGRDVSGAVVHTLRLSAVKTSTTGALSTVTMGACDLPTPLACTETPYTLATDLKRFIGDRLVWATAQTTYPTTWDFYASPMLTTTLTGSLPTIPASVGVTYTNDPTGPTINETLDINLTGCKITLALNTTNLVHFNQITSTGALIGYGPTNADGNYTKFKLVVKMNTTTDTVYGESCLGLKNCLPCGETNPNELPPATNFVATTLECNSIYTAYTTTITTFNNWVTTTSPPGISTVTAETSGWFNYAKGYCGCAESYIALLEAIKSGAISASGTNYNNLNSYCTNALNKPCTPAFNLFDQTHTTSTTITVQPSDTTACEQQLIAQALANAQQAYNEYVVETTTQIAAAYKAHCLSLVENFKVAYTDKEYHLTLYYYDQAGNLIKTVPPEGVEILNLNAYYSGGSGPKIKDIINEDRTYNTTRRVYTQHRLATSYEYNSLNQLVKQNMPDHDPMNIWEPRGTNGLDTMLTITKIHFINENKGFLSGYIPASLSNRGVLYSTNDGGYTWKRVEDVVGTQLNKVHMVTTSNGYAVGNKGILLRTTNGGSTWEPLNTYAANITEDITDVVFQDANTGVAILNTTLPTIVYITSGAGAAPVLTKFTISTTVPGTGGYFTLTGITYNEIATAKYIASAKYKNATGMPETGILLSAVNTAVTSAPWTNNTSITPVSLNKIQYNSTLNKYYTSGTTGHLQQLTIGGTNLDLASGLTGNVIDIQYATTNDAVAIVENTVNQGIIYKTSDAGQTWTQLSTTGEYFKSLNFYEKVTDASGDLYKYTAVGANGLVKRVILQVNNPAGIIDLPNVPSSGSTMNTSWSYVYGGKVHVIVGGDAGKVYYTTDATATTPVWTTQSLGITASEKILKITGFVNSGTGEMAAVILTENGATYKLYKTYKSTATTTTWGTASGVTLAAGVVKDISGADVSGTRTVYLLNNTTRQLYKAPITIAAGAPTVTALTGAIAAYTGQLISIATTTSTDVVVAGTNGLLYKGVLNSATAPTSVTWTTLSATLQPLAFTDVQKAPTSSGLSYATTLNGDIYENSAASTNWKKLDVANTNKLNSLKFDETNTSGIVAGDGGKLYNFTIGLGINAILTELNTTGTSANFTDVAINGTTATAVADNGLILVNTNYPANSFAPALNQSSVALYGASAKPGSTEIIIVGNNAQIRKVAGTTSTKVSQVFTPNLNSVHFYNNQEGYAVGEWLTARHTSDGGATWQIVLPAGALSGTLPNLKGVYCHNTNTAYAVGDQGKVYAVATNTLNPITVAGVSATYVFNDVETSVVGGLTHTYIVGTSAASTGNKAMYYTTTGGASWSNIFSTAVAGEIKGIHTFARNAGYIIVGRNGTAASPTTYLQYGRGATLLMGTAPATSNTLNDVHFIDDVNGYIVGSGGLVYKSSAFTYNTAAPYDYTAMSWSSALSAGPLSAQTVTTNMDIRSVFAINHTTVMTAGVYTAPRVYARLITDEAGRYSTKFWYDKLGRIVVSQNTRQYNTSPKKYSYTLYDALGRVIEAGEKAENASGTLFANIFGTNINTHYNPNAIDDTKLNTWLTTAPSGANGVRSEVTRSYYDQVETAIAPTLPVTFTPTHLRKRISTVAYYPTYSTSTATTAYDHATHYSYDIHGNVKTLIQENRKLAVTSGYGALVTDERYNRIDYTYDLISGNVNKVSYENTKADQWHHKYSYDGDNRITDVYTSDNDMIWDKDAHYIYYNHGPLARIEYGQNQVQGTDYAYTLQGWIKGTNSNDLSNGRDIGRDSYIQGSPYAPTKNPNQNFAGDVASYSLNYHGNDYKPIDQTNRWNVVTDRFEASKTGSNIDISTTGLYNGNIKAMVTTITNPAGPTALPQATLYGYDQLNRLVTAKAWADLNTTTNVWGSTAYAGRYENNFTYDANGNIITQTRKNQAGSTIDNLTYNYVNTSGKITKNRLYHLDDPTASGTYSDDIDDMGTFDNTATTYNTNNNYSYDAEGRLIKDLQEQIQTIVWRVDGKVAEITRTVGSTRKNLKFDYDAMGQRIAKHTYSATNVYEKSTYYVRDAQGNVLATYEKAAASMQVKERDIYGSSRLGMYTKTAEMIGAPLPSTTSYTHQTGIRYYELTNHLGNVLAVITDRKKPLDLGDYDWSGDGKNDKNTPQSATPDNRVDYYSVEMISSADYSPFGVTLDNRNFIKQGAWAFEILRLLTTGENITITIGINPPNVIAYNAAWTMGQYLTAIQTYLTSQGLTSTISGNTLTINSWNSTANTITFNPGIANWRSLENYRYSFQGQEHDDEIKGSGNSINFEFRMYDPRLGRFSKIDPLTGKYPYLSPYAFSGNRVIDATELEGLEPNTHIFEKYLITNAKTYVVNAQEVTAYYMQFAGETMGYWVVQYNGGDDNEINYYYNEEKSQWLWYDPYTQHDYDVARCRNFCKLTDYMKYGFTGLLALPFALETAGYLLTAEGLTAELSREAFEEVTGIPVGGFKDVYKNLKYALGRQGIKSGDKIPKAFKEKWSEEGYDYEVRIHEADSKYGKEGSIFRVSRRQQGTDANGQGYGWEYQDADGSWHPQSTLKPSNPKYNENAAEGTHIETPKE